MDIVRGITLAPLLVLTATACLAAPSEATYELPTVDLGCPPVSSVSDDFESERPDQWEAFGASDCDLRVENGRLELDAAESCGLASIGCYDLSDRWVEVDTVAPGPGLLFAVHLDDYGDDLVISTSGSDDATELAVLYVPPEGDPVTLTALPFDPDVHQLWRIWHSASENEVYFETSRRSAPAWSRLAELWLDGVSVRRAQVRLGASDCVHMVAFDSLLGVEL